MYPVIQSHNIEPESARSLAQRDSLEAKIFSMAITAVQRFIDPCGRLCDPYTFEVKVYNDPDCSLSGCFNSRLQLMWVNLHHCNTPEELFDTVAHEYVHYLQFRHGERTVYKLLENVALTWKGKKPQEYERVSSEVYNAGAINKRRNPEVAAYCQIMDTQEVLVSIEPPAWALAELLTGIYAARIAKVAADV